MNKRKTLFKFSVIVSMLGLFSVSFSSATNFKFKVENVMAISPEAVANSIIPIHFADNYNNFGGFLYLQNDGIEPGSGSVYEYEISNGDEKYECGIKMKGFYYNSERGERLWPLGSGMWNVSDLETEGGIYNLCMKGGYNNAISNCQDTGFLDTNYGGDSDECLKSVYADYSTGNFDEAYFGQVVHTVKGGQKFGLVVGVKYKSDGNWYSMAKKSGKIVLGNTFFRFDKQIPVGFVYDYNGGVGFAGCRLNIGNNNVTELGTLINNQDNLRNFFEKSGTVLAYTYTGGLGTGALDCKNMGTMADSLIKLLVEGLVGMNKESDLGIIGNQSDAKMQYFSSSDINSATLLNYAKQRSEILCRGNWNPRPNAQGKIDRDVVCFDTKSGSGKVVADDYMGKTLIVKDRNVEINPVSDANTTGYYDIFVNGGKLIINEISEPDSNATKKFVFDAQGAVTGVDYTDFAGEIEAEDGYIKGFYGKNLAAVGSLLKGNFVVDGPVVGPESQGGKLNNKYFIYGKFTTKDSFEDFEDKFLWRCSMGYVIKDGKIQDGQNGTLNQGKYCPPSVNGEDGSFKWYNPYRNAYLVVIDQNYESPLFW